MRQTVDDDDSGWLREMFPLIDAINVWLQLQQKQLQTQKLADE